MLKKAKKWIGYDFNYGHYDNPPREGGGTSETDEMRQFFRDFRSDLKAAFKDTNIKIYQMKKNYYDVTLVLSNLDESKFIFVSIGDMRYTTRWNERILYRTMKHATDWTGGMNQYTDTEHLVSNLKDLMERMLRYDI